MPNAALALLWPADGRQDSSQGPFRIEAGMLLTRFTCLGSGLGCSQRPLNHSCIHLRIRNGICVCPQMYHVHIERPLRVIAVSSYLKYHRDTHNGNCCVSVNEVLHTHIHMQKNTKYTYIIIYAYMQTYIHTNKHTHMHTCIHTYMYFSNTQTYLLICPNAICAWVGLFLGLSTSIKLRISRLRAVRSGFRVKGTENNAAAQDALVLRQWCGWSWLYMGRASCPFLTYWGVRTL